MFSMKYMQSCSSVSAEIIVMLSAEQSSEHTAQSSEHEVANDDCNNIVHKHFLFYGLYTIMKIHYVQSLPLGFSDGVERAALGIAIEVDYES